MKPRTVDPVITEAQARGFWAKVQRGTADECWPWQAYTDPNGYGRFEIGSYVAGFVRRALAHRVAYQLTHGAIPAGLSLDHLCRNTSCVNPAHLEPVTHRVNMLRGESLQAKNSRKTHCSICGGDFTTFTTKKGSMYRRCDVCARRRASEQHARRRANVDGATYDPVRQAGDIAFY